MQLLHVFRHILFLAATFKHVTIKRTGCIPFVEIEIKEKGIKR